MKAFHNDQALKEKYLNRVHAHQLADEIIKGAYWENGKGCAVGCTIHSSNHNAYEAELGIPEWLARVEDTIFEGLPNGRAKMWPHQFLDAIHPGADLEKVKAPFMVFILESCIDSMSMVKYDAEKFPDVSAAIAQSKNVITEMIRLWREGVEDKSAAAESAWSAESVAESVARSAAESAWSAESVAESVARSAAWSAMSAESAAWSAAWSAAESAAWSAESVAESAWSAESVAESADSAAWSARSAESAWSARSAAESAADEKYADKLLELLRGCK